MSSKAQRWSEAQEAVEQTFRVSEGVWANVNLIPNDGPHLQIVVEPVSILPTAEEALAFARWIIAEFGEGEGKHDPAA